MYVAVFVREFEFGCYLIMFFVNKIVLLLCDVVLMTFTATVDCRFLGHLMNNWRPVARIFGVSWE